MKITIQIQTLLLLLGVCFSSTAMSHGDEKHEDKQIMFTGTDTEAAKVVVAFHKALESGDAVKARSLLADDVLIMEGSGIERSADEYASHHMLSDMKYLQAIDVKTLEHHVQESSSIAISISRSSSKGVYKGKDIDSEGNETMTLVQGSDGWKITHIHWSN
jgi:ketosteroid isomerase-like protein